jgi:hypothetical protein
MDLLNATVQLFEQTKYMIFLCPLINSSPPFLCYCTVCVYYANNKIEAKVLEHLHS